MKRLAALLPLGWAKSVAQSANHEARVLLRLNPESIAPTRQFPDPFPNSFSDNVTNVQHLNGRSIISLESGATLKADKNRMELVDRYGESKNHHAVDAPPEPEAIYNVPAPIQGEFKAYPSEMYCRYGCGNLQGVTFPYYYRPFFGYGYPLLGTETQFPSGYGGNPLTNLGVAGVLGGASSSPFY